MKKIPVITNFPVPSSKTQRLIWDEKNKEWNYEFHVILPEDKNIGEDKLFLYGHIQQLKLVDKVTKNSINIIVENMEDIYNLLKKQAEEDNKYRQEWIKNNEDYYDNVFTYTTKNKTQDSKYMHVVSILEQDEETTTFIVAPQKYI